MGGLTPLGSVQEKKGSKATMKIKKGVSLQGLRLVMRPVLIEADLIWQKLGQELVITSCTEGEHSAHSLHYYGYALDFRTRYFTQDEKWEAYCNLVQALEYEGYDIFMHDTHIHVEYDAIKEKQTYGQFANG